VYKLKDLFKVLIDFEIDKKDYYIKKPNNPRNEIIITVKNNSVIKEIIKETILDNNLDIDFNSFLKEKNIKEEDILITFIFNNFNESYYIFFHLKTKYQSNFLAFYINIEDYIPDIIKDIIITDEEIEESILINI
jgi:hypothetical protein